jgi:hypothetical protein
LATVVRNYTIDQVFGVLNVPLLLTVTWIKEKLWEVLQMQRQEIGSSNAIWLLLLFLTFAPAIGFADAVDQSSPPGGSGAIGLGTNGFLAQTFTAGVNGWLTAVNISTWENSQTNALFTLTISNVNPDGSPGSTVLASTTVPETNSFATSIVFPTAFAQVAGTQYAIVLEVGAGFNNWEMAACCNDSYLGGSGWYKIDGGGWNGPGFIPLTTIDDFAFQTRVTADAPVPEPATMLLLGSGFTGILLRRRRSRLSVAEGRHC